MSRRKVTRTRGFSRKALVIVGLAAFVAVDIVLMALALGWGRDELQSAESAPRTQSTHAKDDAEEPAEASESATEPLARPDFIQTAPRLLTVVSDTVAWRSEGGVCDQRGSLELTVDGGVTWGATYPVAEGLGRPLWVSGADYTTIQSAVASGAECAPYGVRTFDSGASWSQEGQVIANSVFVDPGDSSLVVWGGETTEGPCVDITAVAVTSGVASAVCSDGSVWSVSPGSSGWSQLDVEGAVALGGSGSRWVAAVESTNCDGLELVEFSEASVEWLACASAEPGEKVALDLNGGTLWVWVGDKVLISTDGGRSLN